MIPIEHYLVVGALLFSIGLAMVLFRRHALMVLMGIELMLNASNLNLVVFGLYDPEKMQGQFMALFLIVIAAAEAAVGLAILIRVYRYFYTADLASISKDMKGD
jgi:NADH-quinone oxidoreductase subunit K